MSEAQGSGPTAACTANLVADDWRRYVAAARRHLLPNTSAARVAYGVAGAAVGVSLGLLPSAGPAGFALLAVTVAALAIALAFNSRFSTALRSGLAGPLAMSANPAGVTIVQGERSTTFEWSAVVGWSEDDDWFFVTVAPFVGWPIPKSGFAQAVDVEWFRHQLAAERPPDGR